ncbi:RND transporter [Herbaspirillum sp. HC18]|nr:RND transporter [Herbaspirillum sp. HC18]
MRMKLVSTLLLALAAGAAATPFAIAADAHHNHGAMHDAQAGAPMSDGEIKKVDKDAKKITIKHGDLKNLGMPPMTMVFGVQDPSLLDKVKTGDKVSFVAEKVGGKLTVTQMEAKK